MSQNSSVVEPVDVLEILWKTLKDNYPMMEYAGVLDDSWLDEYRRKIVEVSDWASAYRLMEELVNRLNDYHTHLEWPGKPTLLTPPVKLAFVKEGLIVVAEADSSTSLKPGDIVLAVDGMNAMVLFRKLLKRAFGATVYAKRNWALNQMLIGDPESPVELTVCRHYKGVFNVRLVRRKELREDSVISYRMLDGGAGYIRIVAFTEGDGFIKIFDDALENLREAKCLVIDVRDNGGGSDGLAEAAIGRFIDRPVLCSINFQRRPGTDVYDKFIAIAKPRGPWQYKGRVAVLINAGCCSACEHFVSGMKEAGALLVGEPTTGACGWSRPIDLPGGAVLYVSKTFPIHGKTPSPLNGIKPHIKATPRLKDLQAGRDVALEAALKTLLSP
ncbi:MAG: S41 family peptidase [Candidatus Bathyarchaeia archaeon]